MQSNAYKIEGNVVKNFEGDVVAVAHQYDRNDVFKRLVFFF